MNPVDIIYEDKEVFVVVKPPGMPSQPERSTAMDMVSYLKNLLAARDKIKNPYIGVVHRLDRPVGGVMVYGKTKAAAAALSAQITEQSVHKEYLAVVWGEMPKQEGRLEDYLIKDGRTNLSCIAKPGKDGQLPKGAKRAVLEYRVLGLALKDGQTFSLLRIRLFTGRHHQIRVQLAGCGHPIAGDGKYGSLALENLKQGNKFFELGLFSCRLEFLHPVTKRMAAYNAVPSSQLFSMFPCINELPKTD